MLRETHSVLEDLGDVWKVESAESHKNILKQNKNHDGALSDCDVLIAYGSFENQSRYSKDPLEQSIGIGSFLKR